MTNGSQLMPLAALDDQPIFAEAWQAEVLAIANSLIETGSIQATQWAIALGDALNARQSTEGSDTLTNYYLAVLDALEVLLEAECDVPKTAMTEMKDRWIAAYEKTPHGAPVILDERGDNMS